MSGSNEHTWIEILMENNNSLLCGFDKNGCIESIMELPKLIRTACHHNSSMSRW